MLCPGAQRFPDTQKGQSRGLRCRTARGQVAEESQRGARREVAGDRSSRALRPW